MLVDAVPVAVAVVQRYNVHSMGRGPATLLFCNGYGCNQYVWHKLAPTLAASHRLVFFDQVGTGGADPAAYGPQKYATLHGHAQDVVAICAALDLQQVTVVGHSEGALVACILPIEESQYNPESSYLVTLERNSLRASIT